MIYIGQAPPKGWLRPPGGVYTMNKQTKLIVGIIICAGIIAGLHFLLFDKKVKEFESARSAYEAAVGELGTVASGNQMALDSYTSETATLSQRMEQIRRGLDLDYPSYMKPLLDGKSDTATMESMLAKLRADIRAEVAAMLNRRSGAVKLNFMGGTKVQAPTLGDNPVGWMIPTNLRGASGLERELKNLADYKLALENLENVPKNAMTRQKFTQLYNQTLSKFEISATDYTAMRTRWNMGTNVPLFSLIGVAELMEQQNPAGYDRDSIEQLLFYMPTIPPPGIGYPADLSKVADPAAVSSTYVVLKQVEILGDLIERATRAEYQIASFDRARVFDPAPYQSTDKHEAKMYMGPEGGGPGMPGMPPNMYGGGMYGAGAGGYGAGGYGAGGYGAGAGGYGAGGYGAGGYGAGGYGAGAGGYGAGAGGYGAGAGGYGAGAGGYGAAGGAGAYGAGGGAYGAGGEGAAGGGAYDPYAGGAGAGAGMGTDAGMGPGAGTGMGPGAGMGPGTGMGPGAGMGPAAAPTAPLSSSMIGMISPIEIMLTGSHDGVINYLYHLSNCERGYEVAGINLFVPDRRSSADQLTAIAVVFPYVQLAEFTRVPEVAEVAAADGSPTVSATDAATTGAATGL